MKKIFNKKLLSVINNNFGDFIIDFFKKRNCLLKLFLRNFIIGNCFVLLGLLYCEE